MEKRDEKEPEKGEISGSEPDIEPDTDASEKPSSGKKIAKTGPRPGSTFKKLTLSQWEQVVTLWELGKATIRELSETFGVTEVAIKNGLKKRGAVRGSRVGEVREEAFESAKEDHRALMDRVIKMQESHLSYNDIITKLAMKEITDAKRTGRPISTVNENLGALDRASRILSRMRDDNYHLFGLYDENKNTEEIPELALTEYTPEEIQALQKNFEPYEEDLTDEELSIVDDEGDIELPFADEEDD